MKYMFYASYCFVQQLYNKQSHSFCKMGNKQSNTEMPSGLVDSSSVDQQQPTIEIAVVNSTGSPPQTLNNPTASVEEHSSHTIEDDSSSHFNIPLYMDATIATASEPQRTSMQLAILGEKKLRYFDMRCEWQSVNGVCNGDPFDRMNLGGLFHSFEPHEFGNLKSMLPNSKINLVQLLEFNKLTKEEMRDGKEPNTMEKMLHSLGIPQHLTLAIHFDEGVLCCDRYQDFIHLSYRDPDQFDHFLADGEHRESFRGKSVILKESAAKSDETVVSFIDFLGKDEGAIVKADYSLLNNCISNALEWYSYLAEPEVQTMVWLDAVFGLLLIWSLAAALCIPEYVS